MLIGSNNSLTYLKPSNIWFKLKRWVVRCQEVSYDEQYQYWGARFFDLRLYVNKYGHIMVKNSSYEYDLSSMYEMLDYFDKRGDVMLKITLDASFDDYVKSNYNGVEGKFKEICHIIDSIYHDIAICGGTRKFDDKVIYSFKHRESNYDGMKIISPSDWSPVYRFVSKWIPFLIGGLNQKYIDKFKDKHVFLVLNYVNRR